MKQSGKEMARVFRLFSHIFQTSRNTSTSWGPGVLTSESTVDILIQITMEHPLSDMQLRRRDSRRRGAGLEGLLAREGASLGILRHRYVALDKNTGFYIPYFLYTVTQVRSQWLVRWGWGGVEDRLSLVNQ